LLPGKNKRVVVERDSQTIVSDSGIYYVEATKRVTTGGNYVLSSPGSGQAGYRWAWLRRVRSALASSTRHERARARQQRRDVVHDLRIAQVNLDTVAGGPPTVYGGRGTLTSCDDSIPDYHFEFKDAKRSGNTLVGRPAILYLKDIPVMWLPFFFSDTKQGRHNGILPPQFGVGDIVRNSPTYRRNVEHVGYYWALNDYMDLSTWLDWRSAAGATTGDPGWLKYNADWNYKWLDRFLGGRIGLTVHVTARRTDEQGHQLEPHAGFLAQQPLQQQSQLRLEYDAPASEHLQSLRGARDDLVAGNVSVQARTGVVLVGRDAKAVSRTRTGRSDFSDTVFDSRRRSASGNG
jgi:hypothetical protein